MNDSIQAKLGGLVTRFGDDIGDDPKRCKALLLDFCSDSPREVNALVCAAQERVPLELRNFRSNIPLELMLSQLTSRLQYQQPLDPSTAQWAVKSWALALGTLKDADYKVELLPELEELPGIDAPRTYRRYLYWKACLFDFSRRNPLLHYRATRVSTVEIRRPEAYTIYRRIVELGNELSFPQYRLDHVAAGEQGGRQVIRYSQVADGDLAADKEGGDLLKTLANIRRQARASWAELSLNSLYLGVGMLSWFSEQDAQDRSEAPLILVPVELFARGRHRFFLKLIDDDIVLNPTLAVYLADPRFGHEVTLPEFDSAAIDDLPRYLRRVRDQVKQRDWSIDERVVLRLFSFQTVRMAEDLDEARRLCIFPGIMRAIAGDTVSEPPPESPVDDLDCSLDPTDIFQVVDADASQVRALAACRAGSDLVIHGPPGTGKSQTIVNLIAQSVFDGKTVLFVSQKKAALDVVLRRMTQVGLADLCLPVHSDRASKSNVLAGMRAAWQAAHPRVSRTRLRGFGKLQRQRARLNNVSQALNQPRGPLGWTIQHVHGRLLRLSSAADTKGQLPAIEEPLDMEPAEWQELVDAAEAVEDAFHALGCDPTIHPWRQFRWEHYDPTTPAEVESNLSALRTVVVNLESTGHAVAAALALPSPTDLGDLNWLLAIARELSTCPPLLSAWLDPARRQDVVQTVQRARTLAEGSQRCRVLLSEAGYDLGIYSVNHAQLLEAIESDQTSLGSRLREPYDPADEASRQASAAILDRAARAIDSVLALVMGLNNTLDLDICPTLEDLDRTLKLLSHLQLNLFFNQDWLEPEKANATLREVRPAAEHALKRDRALERIAQLWTEDVCDCDVDLLGQTVEARFANPLKRLTSAEYRTSRMLLARHWRGARKPRYQDIVALIHDLRIAADARLWLADRDESLAELLGACYEGPQTDFAHVEKALVDIIEILKLYNPLPIPDAVRRLVTEPPVSGNVLADLSAAIADTDGEMRLALEDVSQLAVSQQISPEAGFERADLEDLKAVLSQMGAAMARLDRAYAMVLSHSAAGPGAPLPVLVQAVQQAGDVIQAEEEFAALETNLAVYCGPHFRGLDTQWADLEKDLHAVDRLFALIKTDPHPAPRDACREVDLSLFAGRIAHPSPARRDAGTWCAAIDAAAEPFSGAVAQVVAHFTAPETVFGDVPIDRVPFAEFLRVIDAFDQDLARLPDWYRYQAARMRATEKGLGEILEDLDLHSQDLGDLRSVVERRFCRLWLASAYAQCEAVSSLDAEAHRKLIKRFCATDQRLLATHRDRVVSRWSRQIPPMVDTIPDSQAGTLLREMLKKGRRLPLRILFGMIPDLLLKLKPCIMMSPLSAAAYLPLDQFRERFDLVVFDEGSQVRPEDAAGAMLRGKQAIVVGDLMQLPPTDFFRVTGATDGPDESWLDPLAGSLESILGELIALPGIRQTQLSWHYRSRHESLIRFSNRSYYEDLLLTFPSPWVDTEQRAIQLYHVAGIYDRGRTRRNPVEACRVVDLVAEHVHSFAGRRSLGVITFSLAQEQAIRDELTRRIESGGNVLAEHPELVDEEANCVEPFFVKSLERVQGDERDSIILSTGYGPDHSGKISLNFGPLTREGGERRLNVAITRAKIEMSVVTSLRPGDIRISPTTKAGIRHLREYLAYVQDVRSHQFEGRPALAIDSPFETEVAQALEGLGYQVDRDVGSSAFRVALALRLPGDPRYLVAIGTDGERYASSPVARDRDRLLDEVLRVMGWHTTRAWSKEWLEQPGIALSRLRASIERGKKASASRPRPAPVALQASTPDGELGISEDDLASLQKWTDEISTVPYQEFRPDSIGDQADFRKAKSLAAMILQIVRLEQPIHEDVLRRRVETCYSIDGLGRAERRRLFDEGLSTAVHGRKLAMSDGFVTLRKDQKKLPVPRTPGPTAAPRPIQHIALEEIAALAGQVLPYAYGISEAALARQVSKLLGYTRLTPRRKERIEAAIDLLVRQGHAQRSGDSILPLEQEPRAGSGDRSGNVRIIL